MAVIEKPREDMKSYRINNFWDLVRALKSNPEWLDEMRRLIYTYDLAELPKKFDEFLKSEFKPLKNKVDKIEQDVGILKQDVGILKQDVNTLKQDVNTLKQDVDTLKQDVDTLKKDVSILKKDVENLKKDVKILKEDVKYLKGEVGKLKGSDLERKVRERAPAYFGRLLRKTKVIPIEKLADILEEALDNNIISEKERIAILSLDLAVEGEIFSTRKPVILAVEISFSIYKNDITRVSERAKILCKLFDKEVIPVVMGVEVKKEIEELADNDGILIIKIEY